MSEQPSTPSSETESQPSTEAHTERPADNGAYDDLRQENRVVMRHSIALNIDSFKAATDEFSLRSTREYPALHEAAAPFMSVIIPNYNGRRFLEPLFAGLMGQTLRDFEILFVDDASTDDSVSFVEAFVAQRAAVADPQAPDPEVRLLVNRHNAGFVAACNMAAAAARGRVLVFLNNDTEPEPDWLAELARTLCANPQAAIVTSKVLLFDQRNQIHTTGDQLGRDGIPRNRGVWETDHGQYDDQVSVFSGSGCGTAYRRDAWEMLGGFDEDFWMYLEDVDFAFRAQLLGWDAVYAPHARVYHHLSATSGHTLASYYVGRNTIWMIAKNMPGSLLWRNLPQIAMAQITIALDALRNLRGAAARARLRGQLAGLMGLPGQLRKRQVIQSRRAVEDAQIRDKLA